MGKRELNKLLKSQGLRIADTVAAAKSSVDVIPSGMFSIDWLLLGVGGIPVGRQVELYGPPAAGKSLLAYRFMAGAQRLNDRYVAVCDSEAGLRDKLGLGWVEKQGVDMSRLVLSTETELENVFDQVRAMVESGEFSLIVVDSLAECAPSVMIESDEVWGKKRPVACEPRAITEFVKVITGPAADTNTAIVYVNQVRDKIGIQFGNPETTPGGNALKHTVALRMRMARRGDLQDGETVVGALSSVNVEKSKFGPRSKSEKNTLGHIQFWFNDVHAPDAAGVIHAAEGMGLVEKAGSWIKYGVVNVQGQKNFVQQALDEGWWDDLEDAVIANLRKVGDEWKLEQAQET